MGVFDTIVPLESKPVERVCCKSSIKNLQTKDLDQSLESYKEGQTKARAYKMRKMTKAEMKVRPTGYGSFFSYTIDKKRYSWHYYPRNRVIYAYDWCVKCERMTGQYFKFSNQGLLKRYLSPVKDSPKMRNKF